MVNMIIEGNDNRAIGTSPNLDDMNKQLIDLGYDLVDWTEDNEGVIHFTGKKKLSYWKFQFVNWYPQMILFFCIFSAIGIIYGGDLHQILWYVWQGICATAISITIILGMIKHWREYLNGKSS